MINIQITHAHEHFTKFHAYICMCLLFVTFSSVYHMNLAAILKFPLAILKTEKFAMANEEIFTRT